VRTLGRTGVVTFGGHTVQHEIVSRLADDEVVREIAGSVAEVRAQVPDAVSATFAYPNGRRIDYDARAAAAVVAAGCTAAMTTIDGLNEPATPPLELRRLVVGGDMSHHEFVAHATGAAGLARRALRRG
jgi:peptidoglycan/xylan/chitin deacetylase (PgdA/CDA1 family)